MPKKILVFSSLENNCQLLSLVFDELNKKGYGFHLFSNRHDNDIYKMFKEHAWPATKIYLGPRLEKNLLPSLSFLLLYPFLLLNGLAQLLKLKLDKKSSAIICLGWNDKLVMTLPAKLLGLKTVWLELPETDYKTKLFKLYRRLSRRTTPIIFSSHAKLKLEQLGLGAGELRIIQPGIRTNHFNFQDDIFHKLAQAEQPQKKFFTLGTVTDLNHKQKIEPLFQAVKKCLSVVPNMQLIVVGEGKEKKNLAWLAKKMEIDSLVWFVGEQAQLKKWFESFDVFAITSEKPKLADYNTALAAMASNLPVLGPDGLGFEDIVFENKTGLLLKIEDSEALAQQLIKLSQDKRLRERLGQAGRERVEKYFTSAKMVEQFEKVL